MLKKLIISLSILIIVLISAGACFYNLDSSVTVNVADINQFEIEISAKAKLIALIKGSYYKLYQSLIDRGYSPKDALDYISEGLGDKIFDYALDNSIEAMDATLEFTREYDEPFKYFDEKEGKRVDLAKLQQDFVKSLDTKEPIELSFIVARAQKTKEDLIRETAFRAEYSTNYSVSPQNRKKNIQTAAKYLNGYMIEPEGIMSFNDVVGKRTIDRGFRSADIIYQGKMVKGIGGGVCQVSSTMYNAALMGGMDVVSSSRHSRKVFYLPASRDAMVSDCTDLVLSNPTSYPLFILTKADEREIKIAIYGIKSDLRYEIVSEVIDMIPPKDKIIAVGENISPDIRAALESDDKELLKNIAYNETRVKEPRAGIESQAYLYIYDNDKLIEKNLISHDMYYPQQGEIIRSII